MPYENIYTGYRQREAEKGREQMQNLQSFGMAQGVLDRMRVAQEREQVKQAITSSANEDEALQKLIKLGPAGQEAAQKIYQMRESKAKASQMGREEAFYSPDNISRFMTPGQQATPEEVLPEGQFGPPAPARPAVAPRLDHRAFFEAGATQGIPRAIEGLKALETRDLTRETRGNTLAMQLMQLQEKAREADRRSQDRALDRQARSDAQADARQLRRDMMTLAASMRQPPAGVAVLGADGKPVFVPRGQEIGRTPASSGAAADREEQKGAMADYAETLVSRLETLLESDPRSTTGMLSGVTRGMEAVVNTALPGAIGSQATIAKQTKEQLISVLGQIRGGGAGRLSNQDMRRVDTAIGQLNTGTPEGMAQGLKDAKELIGAMKGVRSTRQATPSQSGVAPSGVDQKLWDVMTTEERQLWK